MYGRIKQYIPMLEWASVYNSNTFTSDAVAAVIVTITMLYDRNLVLFEWVGGPICVHLTLGGICDFWDIAGLGGWTRCGCLTHDRCGNWKPWPYIIH